MIIFFYKKEGENLYKKTIRIINILLIIIYILSCTSMVFAQAIDPLAVVNSGINAQSGTSTLYTLGNAILGILQYVGVGVAIIATLILAMKYMYSAPEEKAEVKKKLIPYIIGGVLVFGAIQLVKLVEVFTNEIISGK